MVFYYGVPDLTRRIDVLGAGTAVEGLVGAEVFAGTLVLVTEEVRGMVFEAESIASLTITEQMRTICEILIVTLRMLASSIYWSYLVKELGLRSNHRHTTSEIGGGDVYA